MTTEEIKKIVDDERAEQLTALLCRHWEVATQRLDTLAQEITDGIDTCTEAEIYAALMRMQRAVMALIELSKTPTALLFSEYLERIGQTVSNASIRHSVITLIQQLLGNHADTTTAEWHISPQTRVVVLRPGDSDDDPTNGIAHRTAGGHPTKSLAHAVYPRRMCPTPEP